MTELKPCPFCGGVDTHVLETRRSLEDCIRYDYCEAERCEQGACDMHNTWDRAVCSIHKGGCGASTGYASCPSKAAALWNRRAERTCHIVQVELGSWECDRCGTGIYCDAVDEPPSCNYCPACGAKVVKE